MSDILARRAYRRTLGADMPTNIACVSSIVSLMMALCLVVDVAVPGSQTQHRQNPLYWVLLLPFAWWAVNIIYFEKKVVWSLVPVLLVAPAMAAACLLFRWQTSGFSKLSAVVTSCCLVLSAVGLVFYRRSRLRRDGPYGGW